MNLATCFLLVICNVSTETKIGFKWDKICDKIWSKCDRICDMSIYINIQYLKVKFGTHQML